MNWGDGAATTPIPSGGSCSGSHTFVAPGAYTITVSVTDDDGGTGSATVTVLVTSRWHPRTRSMSSAPRVRRTRSQRRSAPGRPGAFRACSWPSRSSAARTPARLARTTDEDLHVRGHAGTRRSRHRRPRGCFTDSQGSEGCDQATKEWRDTTPPVVRCTPTTAAPASNPQSGQNPDGFYRLTAVDAVDPDPDVFLADDGSTFVAGPFASGVRVKITAPEIRPWLANAGTSGEGATSS